MKKFEQLKSAYHTLCGYMDVNDVSDMAISAVTADFDRIFELSWKTLREYMLTGLAIRDAKTGSPREILKLAYQENLIDNEELWLSMLADRNDDTHLYRKSDAIIYANKIETVYMDIIKELIDKLSGLIEEDRAESISLPLSLVRAANEANIPLYRFIEEEKARLQLGTDEEVFREYE